MANHSSPGLAVVRRKLHLVRQLCLGENAALVQRRSEIHTHLAGSHQRSRAAHSSHRTKTPHDQRHSTHQVSLRHLDV
uniref:Uncharacterized protein n=1 Tax=uncultured marine virus TaxID=186617 RepID=A0A0F7L389_9VIRU|nr:hypothetical protein [uncultured marine virus]